MDGATGRARYRSGRGTPRCGNRYRVRRHHPRENDFDKLEVKLFDMSSADHKNLGGDVGSIAPADPRNKPAIAPSGMLTLGLGFSTIMSGSGVPANAIGNDGDFYFRQDTPATANQRIYVHSAGAWVGIV
jgi:hypothetical protein